MAILFGVVDAKRAAIISSALTRNWTPIGAASPELPGNVVSFISSFEIQSHFVAKEGERSLDLIKRSWGWYIDNPNGTESTVIEGYLTNGTFGYRSSRGYGYDASYVSHAHGWSSGPTSALTEYVAGLSVTSRLGKTWNIAPQFAGLKFAEAGFMTALGKFQVSWERKASGKYSLIFCVPSATSGTVILPLASISTSSSITLNGKKIKDGIAYRDSSAILDFQKGGSYVINVG